MKQKTADKKLFRAYWGEGYYKRGTRKVREVFFSNDNGYEPEMIQEVSALKLGEKADFTGISGYHTVTRIN